MMSLPDNTTLGLKNEALWPNDPPGNVKSIYGVLPNGRYFLYDVMDDTAFVSHEEEYADLEKWSAKSPEEYPADEIFDAVGGLFGAVCIIARYK